MHEEKHEMYRTQKNYETGQKILFRDELRNVVRE